MKNLFHLIAFLLVPGFLPSQTLVTDRPDQTESALVVPKGWIQLESGLQIQAAPYISEIEWFGQLLRIALLEGAELRLTHSLATRYGEGRPRTTYGGYNLGTKVQLIRKEQLELALIASADLAANGNPIEGTHLRLSAAYPLSDQWALGTNLEWQHLSGQGHALEWTLVLGHGLSERASWFVEAFGSSTEGWAAGTNLYTGIAWLATPLLQLDLAFGTHLTSGANFATLGMSFAIF